MELGLEAASPREACAKQPGYLPRRRRFHTFCEEHNFGFDLVVLSPYTRYGLEVYDPVAKGHVGIWQAMQPSTEIRCASSLAEATRMVTERWYQEALWTLITGSTYLVGEAMQWLQIGQQLLDRTSHDHAI
ncbi:hypothetical protein B0I37DRAFT_402713 [Chaetomium sp. MPI-CAGE-AT-0009]|nr:hypothetical protein B0I37DRAFT_402713 [Chaetomium sp. MPI-CAGE-AT-0009]